MKPILFSTEMVQAILKGTKTQTRRVVKFRNKKWKLSYEANDDNRTDLDAFGVLDENGNNIESEENMPATLKQLNLCPFGNVGDILWVRETWCKTPKAGYCYKASTDSNGEEIRLEYLKCGSEWAKWRPSIHMPKQACRILLRITEVKIERLQDITTKYAEAEGAKPIEKTITNARSKDKFLYSDYREGFMLLWNKINGRGSWEENPWVWVIEFERVK